jgi:hypothetical protein
MGEAAAGILADMEVIIRGTSADTLAGMPFMGGTLAGMPFMGVTSVAFLMAGLFTTGEAFPMSLDIGDSFLTIMVSIGLLLPLLFALVRRL